MSDPAAKPEPHPGAAAFAIATMALAVAAVLFILGITARIDGAVAGLTAGLGLEGQLRPPGPAAVWIWTVLVTVGLSQAMLHTQGNWRRVVLLVTTVILTVLWAPVLALAAYAAPLGVPLIALLWAGIGSEIYATRHREPT